MLRYSSLGSGSDGNALLVEATGDDGRATRVLLDCGFGLKEAVRRLESRGVAAESLDAILVTHEHVDHAGGVARLARCYDIAIFASHGTRAAMLRMPLDCEPGRIRVVCSHTPFTVGALRIEPFPVPHDAREPTQFVFGAGERRLGVLTDAGAATPHIVGALARCDSLILEFNHDEAMLERSRYPWSVRQRIASPYGHLSNRAAAAILASLDRSRLRRVHAAHLSRQNNRAELVLEALTQVDLDGVELAVATQDDGFDWHEA